MTQSKTLDTGSDGMEEPLAHARLKKAILNVARNQWPINYYARGPVAAVECLSNWMGRSLPSRVYITREIRLEYRHLLQAEGGSP